MKLAIAVVLALASSSVAAAGDARDRAAVAFASAERAFADEDYPEALRLFRDAFAAAPDDSVRFNIAVCLERLGRFREAGIEYDGAAASATLPADVRARARTEATRVRARLGQLDVAGEPIGAVVRVDGVELCKLPCAVDVDPGRREVVAESKDASDRKVVVVERAQQAHVSLHAVLVVQRRGVGWLTWVGLGGMAAGTAGTIGFGLHARTLHDRYLADPTTSTRDSGLLARDLTNASIAVGAAGLAAAALDIFVLARRTHARPREH